MATETTSALGQNIEMAAGIAKLLSSLTGSESTATTSGKTTTATKQTNISDAGIQALIKQMLEDQSTGLAKVASGSKNVGLYDSSTQQLLVNDLIARAAANAEIARAPTTTTETSTPTTVTTKAQGLLGDTKLSSLVLPALGVGMLMKKDDSGKSGFDSLTDAIGGMFGSESGGGDSAPSIVANIADNFSANTTTLAGVEAASGSWSDALPGVVGSFGEFGGSIIDSIGDLGNDAFTSVKDIADDVIESISGWF